jgi:tetratricopeptide (TPR) repeat protein
MRGLSSQAAPLLEKAVEIDPNFAMAYAKLAVVNHSLGLQNKRDEFAKRALTLTDRLTTRERYYIEGFYYGLRPETIGRSIEAYQHGLRLHPEHHASRHNLGLHLIMLERFPESIEQYEELVRRGTPVPTTYENLVEVLIVTGNMPRARQVAEEFVKRRPDSAVGLRALGSALGAEGRFDDARAVFAKSETLDPLDFVARLGKRWIAGLQERWADAEAVNDELTRSPNPFQRFLGLGGSAQLAGARGRGQTALDFWDRAARVDGLSPMQRSLARNRLAMTFLRRGDPARALAQAELALVDARNRDSEFETLQLLAVAQARVGRNAESEKTLALLASRAMMLPSEREVRRVRWARGEIAFFSGDTGTAVTELTAAEKMLSAYGPPVGPPSSHADLRLAAALAYVKEGRDDDAASSLERLQKGHERTFSLEAYGRSFFLLGQIYERRGDQARARQQYARFVELWGDGDLEREWVAEATKKR